MDTIRKKLAPKKEVPRKIEISAPSLHPAIVFGPGKIARYAEPEDTPEERANLRALSYDIPAYSERTDHPTRPPLKSKRAWQKCLHKKTFEVIIPPEKGTSTFQPSGYPYSTPFQFCEEEHEAPRKAPTWEEQLARYPPTHTSDGFMVHPTPPPSGYVPFQIQQALDRARKLDEARGISSSRGKKSAGAPSKGKGAPSRSPGIPIPPASAKASPSAVRPAPAGPSSSPSRTPSAVRPDVAGPSSSPSRTPTVLNTTSAMPAPPRLRDVIKQPEYEDFSPEQKKDLLPPPSVPDRHARLKQKLAEAREAKKAKEEEALKKTAKAREAAVAATKQSPNIMATESPEGRQPLVGDFVNNSASTPATPLVHQGGAGKDTASPVKSGDIAQSPAASSRKDMSAPRTAKASNVPASVSLARFRFGGGSSHRADVENSASTPPRLNTGKIDYRNAPLPSLPHEATHERQPSRDAVYHTREDIARAGMRSLGHSARAPSQNPSLTRPRDDESTESILPTQQHQEATAGPSNHVRSASASSIKRQGGVGLPPTTPLRIHKRNASNPVEARSVFDYASATTSRASPQPPGPPPVMRHRDLIDKNDIKRPGRLDSLPISARSKNAKEEYFTPPPRRIRTNSSGQESSHFDAELGVLAPKHVRNASASAATAPPKIRLATGHGHSQSLTERGLPAHPAVFLPAKKAEAKRPEIPRF